MNWQTIKNEYVTGDATLRELAEAHGVTPGCVRGHACAEHWTAERKKHREQIAEMAKEKSAEKISDACSEVEALKARMRILLFKELAARVEKCSGLGSQDFRRLVQNYLDMVEAEPDGSDGNTNELLQSIYELESEHRD